MPCVRLDVDKLDYLLRDAVSIGEPCPDFLSRLLDNIRGNHDTPTYFLLEFVQYFVWDFSGVADSDPLRAGISQCGGSVSF